MKTLIAKLSVAICGLSLAALPLAASADQVSVGVNVGGPGYHVRARYVNPNPPRYWHPARVVYYDGYYGRAPAGFYGYYWHGGWYMHRRWANGIWIYF